MNIDSPTAGASGQGLADDPSSELDRSPTETRPTVRKAADVIVEEISRGAVRVPLAGTDQCAIVDRADYERLIRAGISPCWQLNRTGDEPGRKAHVKVTVKGRLVPVARLILQATPRGLTVYGYGGRLDLRRSNIRLKKVAARGEGRRAVGKRAPAPSEASPPSGTNGL